MAWCNSYTPPVEAKLAASEIYGPEPYDLNFCFPINTDVLENDRVKLTPFIPRLHAHTFFDTLSAHPVLYRYLPFPPPKSVDGLAETIEVSWRRNPAFVLFAVFDKTRPCAQFEVGSFAGVMGLLYSSPVNLVTEIGYVVILPAFQRTHVLSNATGLLLQYCLNVPTDTPAGLGLRRVQWAANIKNINSQRAATRMGFKHEAIIRWNWALPEGKEGNEVREVDPRPKNLGRDSALLAICWDDWVSGTREKVEVVMARKS